MPTVAPNDALRLRPVAPPGVYDEAFSEPETPRAAWARLVDALSQVSTAELHHRSLQADQLLHESGMTYDVFREGNRRPWQLDLLPMMIDAGEWQQLEDGLAQRARLLQWIVRDCHGPRRLLEDGSLPPEILFANPRFVRAFDQLHTAGPFITFYAAELARGPRGIWRVMADRAEAPAGAAFALENRIVASRVLPPQLARIPIQRLAPFFMQLQTTLTLLGRRHAEHPRVVMLTPGSRAPFYFEDVYLARYLGYPLVEGGDLAVRDDRVFLKTLAGLVPIDVVLSRGLESGIDPLELGGGASHGVPGLLHAMRTGQVTIANTPGSGLIESPVFMALLPALCRRCLGEELLLPSIPTWWCGDREHARFVREHLAELVIKPAFHASGGEEILPGRLTADERTTLWERIAARPHNYVAQELISRSAVPVLHEGTLRAGHAALRTFLVADGDNYRLMPGALVRVAATPAPMELSIAAGEHSKDLWVHADGPVKTATLLADDGQPVILRRTSAVFPSRVADDLFWLGQSLDRADFLARLLRETVDRLTLERTGEPADLAFLVRALADQGQIEPGFAIETLSGALPALADDLPRIVADVSEVRGLAAVIHELGRLASLERLWLSPDTWRKIRDTTEQFQAHAGESWTGLVDVQTAVNDVILGLAAVSGLIHDGMVRSPAWRLLDIGRRVERARSISGLVQSLLACGPYVERAALKTLLEVIDCRLTYRARYLDNIRQNAALDLCLTDETCPRSAVTQLVSLAEHVDALPHDLNAPLRTEEKRLVMSAVHTVRMISPEQLEPESAAPLSLRLAELDLTLRHFVDLLSRKYLVHSGVPRQIATEGELT